MFGPKGYQMKLLTFLRPPNVASSTCSKLSNTVQLQHKTQQKPHANIMQNYITTEKLVVACDSTVSTKQTKLLM